MAGSFAQISTDALALSADEREQLAAIRWKSLDPEDEYPLSESWETEIRRRLQEVDDGAETIPAEEVLAELQRKYP